MQIKTNTNYIYNNLQHQFKSQYNQENKTDGKTYNAYSSRMNNAFYPPISSTTSITFTSNVSNGAFLRNLSGIHDPYSGVVMLNNKEMHEINQNLMKMTNANDSIKYLNQYKESMLPVEKQMFKIFQEELQFNRHLTLQNIIHKHNHNAMTNLIKTQRNIFSEIYNYANDLPEKEQNEVYNLLSKSSMQILLPHEDKNHFKKSRFINELVEISQIENIKKIHDKIIQLPKEQRTEALNRLYDAERYMNNYQYNVNIEGKTPLSRLQELQKEFIPETLNEINPLEPIIDIALTLPTSKNDINSYIVEMSDKDNYAIAKRLISESLGTIEHIIPNSKGGENEAYNFILVTKSRNEERGNMAIQSFIKRYPDIPQHCQKYINDIMKSAQDGKMRGFEWYPYIISNSFTNKMNINVDIKSYRVSPQKAFKIFPSRLKEKYPQYNKYFTNPQ